MARILCVEKTQEGGGVHLVPCVCSGLEFIVSSLVYPVLMVSPQCLSTSC